MVSAEYKRGPFWIQIGKNMQIFFARLWMCELQQWLLYKSYEVLGTAKNSKLKSW